MFVQRIALNHGVRVPGNQPAHLPVGLSRARGLRSGAQRGLDGGLSLPHRRTRAAQPQGARSFYGRASDPAVLPRGPDRVGGSVGGERNGRSTQPLGKASSIPGTSSRWSTCPTASPRLGYAGLAEGMALVGAGAPHDGASLTPSFAASPSVRRVPAGESSRDRRARRATHRGARNPRGAPLVGPPVATSQPSPRNRGRELVCTSSPEPGNASGETGSSPSRGSSRSARGGLGGDARGGARNGPEIPRRHSRTARGPRRVRS